MTQRITKVSNEESSDKHDEETDDEIVGASSSGIERQTLSEPKRKIRNPYGCKDKPNDKVELNYADKKTTKLRGSFFFTPIGRMDEGSGKRIELRTTKNLGNS